ncbi:MAG: arylesterase [Oscillatoria sp. PMC 1051.18]|nr:arylesterase [Oscillatoria sp. PMC 1050.18]MEC5029081.1 arylesterase [Oscillatoria sp. PMC 1051.18]
MKKIRWLYLLTCFFASLLTFTSCSGEINNVKNLQAGVGEQIIILGDSIASGYGVAESEAFPAVLSQKLDLPILNKGVSGDTTAMGLSRLEKDVLAENPWLVIVELGGNDYLRKIPKLETEENLRKIVTSIQEKQAIVVLLGMNLGIVKDEYEEIYDRVAADTGAYLIPQVLKGILDESRHRQDDVIHPNATGHKILAERIAKDLQPLLAKAKLPPALKK